MSEINREVGLYGQMDSLRVRNNLSLRRNAHSFRILAYFIDNILGKVILICGRSGSGKWTLARYIVERYRALLYTFSHPLHAILADLDIPNTRENLATLSLTLRKNFSENILGLWAREYVEKNRWQLIVLEWIRRIESLKDWRDQIDHIIWIDTKPEIRYSRMLRRGEKSAEYSLSYTEFIRQESLETECSLEKLREISDIVIENDTFLDDLYKKYDTYLNHQ